MALIQLFTDGITNKLVGCYHRPSVTTSLGQNCQHTTTSTNPTNDSDVVSKNPSSLPSADNDADSPVLSTSEVVLIRIYGNKTDLLIDRQAETRNIKMLQRHGFAPRLYALFENGLAYEYVPGVTLSPSMVVSANVWPLVAQHMAKMHRLTVRMTAGNPEPMLGPKTRAFLDLVPERFSDSATEAR